MTKKGNYYFFFFFFVFFFSIHSNGSGHENYILRENERERESERKEIVSLSRQPGPIRPVFYTRWKGIYYYICVLGNWEERFPCLFFFLLFFFLAM